MKCLSKVIPSLIHIDQVGFVPGRLASSNMRRLLQVMSKASSLQRPAIALLLDTEKAFDRIEWPYLFHVLAKYGFRPVVLNWIRALYFKQMSSVKTNGLISNPTELTRSTRQGDLLSATLFISTRTSGVCYSHQ